MILRRFIIPFLVFIYYKVWSWTWRLKIHEPEDMKARLKNKETVILAHWHGDELVLLGLIGYYRVATMTSTSKDGEIMNTLVHLVGGLTSRGSATRGGVRALKGLLRIIKNKKRNCSMAVDGPKGPLHKAKPGVFELARLLKAPIYVAGVTSDRAIHFTKSWNKTYLPKLFSKVVVVWEGPHWVDKSDDARDPELAKSLEDAIHKANASALKLIAGHDAQC